jgi:monofunctional biosynthetic peptidoglycan transglycosylase
VIAHASRGQPRRYLGRVLALILLAAVAWIAYETMTWPDVATLARNRPQTTQFIEQHRARERAAGRDGRVAWAWVPYTRISPHLKRAVLVAEDVDFFSHHGFAMGELRQALTEAIEQRELPRGASTITQQLAKNLWLSPAKNPIRKGKEALLTIQIERTLGKRRILELYLNVVELGPGVYGAEAASRRYFGKPALDVSEDEAAQLAAALPNPSAWHPGAESRAYRRYVEAIRRRMAKAEFLWRLI